MTIIETLKTHFPVELPRLASGCYVHIFALRHSQSFPIFQTDGVLNTARTQAGLVNDDTFNRLVMFKRKQTTPERLSGRELLRSLGITSGTEGDDNYCAYNGEKSCKQCPDCVIYGFAIGDSGAERSKVYSDSAFSLTPYETSHHSMTFNAPSEGGTMSEGGQMRSSINEQDHIIPEVIFPVGETLRDPTYEGLLYVLGNLLRTRRYGAQESRTGTMKNHIVGLTICNGEVFSNLQFTQALYDHLSDPETIPEIQELKAMAADVVQVQLASEPVQQKQAWFGEDLAMLLDEVTALYQDEAAIAAVVAKLNEQTQAYSAAYGAMAGKKKGKASS